MTCQEFKDEYFTLNKDLLDKVDPDLHHGMMLAAYTKHHDKSKCRDYYQENKNKLITCIKNIVIKIKRRLVINAKKL